jgi:thiol-disulfide isomerase/thioredoxin
MVKITGAACKNFHRHRPFVHCHLSCDVYIAYHRKEVFLMKRLFVIMLLHLAAVVALAQAVTLEGQVVCCADCWMEADRKTVAYGTAEDVEKAAQCIANGDPTLLAVANKEGGWTLYQLESGKYKRPGKNWLDFVGKHVSVTGSTRSKGERHFVKVDSLAVLRAPAISGSEPAPNVIGAEVELALKDLFGVEQRLSSLRGRVVVLNFWATYCVPCKKEMPDLAAIQNQYAPFGVQVVGAAADTADDQPKVTRFIKEAKVNFPVWLGATADDMKRFGLGSALPGTVIIGRDGKVVAQIRGIIKPVELKKQLDALLAKDEAESKNKTSSARTKPPKAADVPS